MKMLKSLAIACGIALTAVAAQAQTLEETISKNLALLDTRKSMDEMMPAVSQLELAAGQYPDDWAANYYAAYAKITQSFQGTDIAQRDEILDGADTYAAVVKEKGPDNAETYILLAMIANARMAVDGEHRWQKYGAIFSENLDKAKSLDADNPRIYYLKGVGTFYTPAAFGGGAKNALPLFEQAKALFAKENKSSVLDPYWGTELNDYYINECTKPQEELVKPEKPKKEKKKK